MLQTQLILGQLVSRDLGKWDDILDKPTVETRFKKNGEPITNYVLSLIFDLDVGCIRVDPSQLSVYDAERSPAQFFNVKVQGGNNKAFYVCAESEKLEQLRKSFFGVTPQKNPVEPIRGQFTEAIDKDFPTIKKTPLYQTLTAIFHLRQDFEKRYLNDNKKQLEEGDIALLKEIELKANERITLVATSVIWSEKGWSSPILFGDIPGYQEFLAHKFSAMIAPATAEKTKSNVSSRLCYATGLPSADVGELTITERYSLNKMFVTTTINYASGWDKADFSKSYQVDHQNQLYLERGSKRILENYKIQIADCSHCIILTLFSRGVTTNFETILNRLRRQSNSLFGFTFYEQPVEDAGESKELYWITFLGFESDGNFFKTINTIEAVSRTHFESLIRAFQQIRLHFEDLPGVDWTRIMSTGKERRELAFNLFTVFGLIPVWNDKEKKNEALSLFRQVLEKRPVERQKLFSYFKKLIVCHRYEQYNHFTNIYPNSTFDFAVRNAVFQYLAFIHVLNQCSLLSPISKTDPVNHVLDVVPVEQLSATQQRVDLFLTRMSYTDAQKGFFYLGRALRVVADKQHSKGSGHKPVLDKLNYNGMNNDDVLRLREHLLEKAIQLGVHRFTKRSLALFTHLVDSINGLFDPNETLFFILSGYSFYDAFLQEKSQIRLTYSTRND